MVVTVVYWIVFMALTVKVYSNLMVPYRVLKLPEGAGISLGFTLLGDLLLFTFAVVLAWAVNRPGPLYEVGSVAAVAGGAILGSYVHYFVVLMVNDWLKRKRGPDSSDQADQNRPGRDG